MKNYRKAEKIIEEYRKLRLFPEKKNAFELHKRLSEVGYTVEEFIQEQKQHIVKELKIGIREIDSSVVLEEVIAAHKKEENTCLMVTQNHPIVYVGNDGFNEQFCIENNISIYRIGYGGGTIIAGKDDLTLGVILNNPNMMGYFRNKLKEWITNNFELPTLIGNDLMIGENKVVGTATRQTGNKTLYCIQVSFSVDLDLIQRISTKEMIKIPKGLSYFGNKDKLDLIKEVKSWLQ